MHIGTVSEYRFDLTDTQEIKLVPYLDRSSKIRVKILKKITEFQGTFNEIEKGEDSTPDPLGLSDKKGFILIEKEECK